MSRDQVQRVIRELASDFEGKDISPDRMAGILLERLYILIPIAEEFLLDKSVQEIQNIINKDGN